MKIGVIGVGRLGICFALLLERVGFNILVSDIRADYVNDLNNKQINTTEPEVAKLLANTSNFKATISNVEVLKECDIVYTMVATPSLPNGSYSIDAVWDIVREIKACDFSLAGKILVIGCTTNPGDCKEIQEQVAHTGITVLYNPEFIAQGSIIRDLENADLVLIGGEDTAAIKKFSEIYYHIQKHPNIRTMSLTAAEIVKIGINCYLTTKISFANMIGETLVMSGLENEIDNVLETIGSDKRIGKKYLKYGYGFGGPCLPRDNRSLGHYASKLGMSFNLGKNIDQFNNDHLSFLTNFVIKQNKNKLPFYLSYISYKPNTDIFEESQQLLLCKDLLLAGFVVYVEDSKYIPDTIKDTLQSFGKVKFIKLNNEEVYKIDL